MMNIAVRRSSTAMYNGKRCVGESGSSNFLDVRYDNTNITIHPKMFINDVITPDTNNIPLPVGSISDMPLDTPLVLL